MGVLLNAPGSAASISLTAPNHDVFGVQIGHFGAGQLIQGTNNAFDGLNRLQVGGADYAPASLNLNLSDGGRTVTTAAQNLAGLTVSREVTVPNVGSEDFARTVDSFTNSTGSPISTSVTVVGNLGSDAATKVFATSDGTGIVSPNDRWIGTDDADGTGTPAIIHYICGPAGLQPAAVNVIGDNVTWTYDLTVPAGQTVRLAYFTIVSTTRAGAIAAANTLVTPSGFGGQAAAFLTSGELASLADFAFSAPDLTVAKTHAGNFEQGDVGDTYTITVSNVGLAPTDGTVNLADALPAGLTATAFSGDGWTVNLSTLMATRSDALAAGASYPALTLTVNVATDAPASVTNTATVSGGGESNTANDTASDPTAIAQLIDLTVVKTHSGNFKQGDSGDTYTITVSNVGLTPSSGAVSLVDSLPAGLTATALSGYGWTVNLSTLTATRSDSLAAGASYPALTLTVNVGLTAPASLTNVATVSGGGEVNTSNDTANDVTTVTQVADLTVTKTHAGNFKQGDAGDTYTITVSNVGLGPTSGMVSLVDSLPAGLTATALSGNGWTVNLSTLTATRSDALAAGASYPALTLVVNVAANAPAGVTNVATVSGGGEVNTANDVADDSTTITTVPPTVTGTTPSLTGGTLTSGTTSLAVSFSKPMVGAGNAANYQLQSVGSDGLLGTSDDVIVPLAASYTGTTATLTFAALPENVYRLTVSDTITDTGGNPLQGAGNGTAGDWVADFVVVAASGAGFAPVTTFSSGGSSPWKIAAGDFNGDGKPDLAVTNMSSGTVGILLGNGSGGFSAAKTFATGGAGSSGIVAADFNGDGKLDLAVTNMSGGTVGILLGNGDGTFSAATVYGTGGSSPFDVVAADFNGDGKLDLAVTNTGSNSVGILLGNGNGTFSAATTFGSGGSTPYGLAAGDFNGDGKPDLAVANWSGVLGILLGNGSGGFASPTTFNSGGANCTYVTAGDFNGDGKPDLAVSNYGSNNVGVLLGTGSGGFGTAATFSSGGSSPTGIVAADLNGDGKADLAVTNYGGSTVGVLLGNGSGSFAAATTFNAGGNAPNSVAVGDFNGDSKPDLAVADNGAVCVGILLNVNNVASVTMNSPHGLPFDVAVGSFGMGELIQGYNNAFDGYGRLMIAGTVFEPTTASYSMADGGQSVVTASGTFSGLTVSRKITVPNTGGQDFARTVDVFTNSTGSPVSTAVTVVGNLGSDAATNVFATSDGTGIVSPNDQWIGTDDATDGGGTPAVIHYIHGPAGLQPASVSVIGDNIEWTYNLTVPAGQTVRLAYFTIVNSSRSAAVAAANALVTPSGFGGQAAAFLTSGELASLADFAFPVPDLTVVKTHSGNFKQGDSGDTYTITVSNVGLTPSSGAVSLVDLLPAGLTATAFSGDGWTINLAALTATRSDPLAVGASYPALTLTVNVAANAPVSVTNTATVSGGGEVNTSNDTASDPTTIIQVADLTVTKTHAGNFRQGDIGDTYTITVSNVGLSPTSGAVSLVDSLPSGLTATGLSGSGWTTDLASLTATRTDTLAAGASYAALTLVVNVAANAPASVTNVATVSGGGEVNTANDVANDLTIITPPPDLTVTKTHAGNFKQGDAGDSYTITVSNVGLGPTAGTVSLVDSLPAGLTAATFSGTGWTANLSTLTATRSDALAAGASYPALTLTVNVGLTAPASLTNVATVSGGGEVNTANDTASDPTTIINVPPAITGTTPSLTGGTLGSGTTSLTVGFNRTMVGAGTAANYQLQSLGPDGLLGTADNTVISLSASYSGQAATLTFPALTASVYRLTVRDAITDSAGRHLDGDGDGTDGGNYVRDFVVVALGGLSFTGPTSLMSVPDTWTRAIVPGDFNHDGNVDLAVVTQSNPGLYILLGNGSGGFSAPVSYATGGTTPMSAVVADFNGDGIPDIAVGNSDNNTFGVLLGKGDGTFSAVTTYSGGSGAIAAADLNGDGHMDLIAANYTPATVTVRLGDGKGGFSAPTVFKGGGTDTFQMALGDFNGDGKIDVATDALNTPTISIMLGNGAGGFSAPTTFSSSFTSSTNMVAADFNGDGKLDLAVGNCVVRRWDGGLSQARYPLHRAQLARGPNGGRHQRRWPSRRSLRRHG